MRHPLPANITIGMSQAVRARSHTMSDRPRLPDEPSRRRSLGDGGTALDLRAGERRLRGCSDALGSVKEDGGFTYFCSTSGPPLSTLLIISRKAVDSFSHMDTRVSTASGSSAAPPFLQRTLRRVAAWDTRAPPKVADDPFISWETDPSAPWSRSLAASRSLATESTILSEYLANISAAMGTSPPVSSRRPVRSITGTDDGMAARDMSGSSAMAAPSLPPSDPAEETRRSLLFVAASSDSDSPDSLSPLVTAAINRSPSWRS
mmetsp:Transcript_3952/g.12836  ORF Transcript_3952/g.12836 Transcript_3952/m.12836 type:complete len:262 (+) Transcript_3952:3820-4605(+)